MNAENVLSAADIAALFVKLIGMVPWHWAGWMGEDGVHGEFQKKLGDLEHEYKITTDLPMGKKQPKLLGGGGGMSKDFHELYNDLLHRFQ